MQKSTDGRICRQFDTELGKTTAPSVEAVIRVGTGWRVSESFAPVQDLLDYMVGVEGSLTTIGCLDAAAPCARALQEQYTWLREAQARWKKMPAGAFERCWRDELAALKAEHGETLTVYRLHPDDHLIRSDHIIATSINPTIKGLTIDDEGNAQVIE